MNNLYLILVFKTSHIMLADKNHIVQAPSVVLTYGSEPFVSTQNAQVLPCSPAHLQSVYSAISSLLSEEQAATKVMINAFCRIRADELLLTAAKYLSTIDFKAMLSFVLAYCLVVDKENTSALVRKLLGAGIGIFEFMYQHRLEPWAVGQYAEELGLPLHKFNQLFNEHYGISPKQWLIEQRLQHAHYLLQNTAMKIIEVSQASGFTNPAYFSDRFRRYFQASPRDIRLGLSSILLPGSVC